jgi:hypothetical protein
VGLDIAPGTYRLSLSVAGGSGSLSSSQAGRLVLAVIVILVGVAVGGLSQKPPVSRGSGMTLPPRPSPRDQLGNRHDGEAHPEREQDNA